MADANRNVAALSQDRFLDTRESFQSRRTFPPSHFTDDESPAFHPWMKLSHRWIEEAGFEAGERLHIEVAHKRLVITPIDDARGAPVEHGPLLNIGPATTGDAR